MYPGYNVCIHCGQMLCVNIASETFLIYSSTWHQFPCSSLILLHEAQIGRNFFKTTIFSNEPFSSNFNLFCLASASSRFLMLWFIINVFIDPNTIIKVTSIKASCQFIGVGLAPKSRKGKSSISSRVINKHSSENVIIVNIKTLVRKEQYLILKIWRKFTLHLLSD